ncbi:DUF5789 family protein [Halorientalis pallida]|uniref:DUF2795 domain-containing protein n=1 Tax=Halorientalis pallida TaxID=2479928 RepID=A0A498KS76_9EURY|nr:hypothetical protein [Halorientalis pallida]RXK46646.1 hypothetical protein EAF64_18385 [Halorientalis pallida]
MGLDFGELRADFEDESYPLSKADLLAAYGDREIGTESGTKTLDEILGPVGGETFDGPDAVQQTVLTMVGASAAGRTDYSDRRTSQDESEQESF